VTPAELEAIRAYFAERVSKERVDYADNGWRSAYRVWERRDGAELVDALLAEVDRLRRVEVAAAELCNQCAQGWWADTWIEALSRALEGDDAG
jgi:hypothetical protein